MPESIFWTALSMQPMMVPGMSTLYLMERSSSVPVQEGTGEELIAFSSINFPYPAVVQDQKVIRYIPPEEYEGDVRFFHEMNNSIYVLKLVPGLGPDILDYVFEKYQCIVIESFGVGGIPEYLVDKFYEVMKDWESRGKLAIVATQVVKEGSNMMVYEVGKKVKQDFDLLETYDMTLEATLTKAMWLMARPYSGYEEMKREFYRRINHDIMVNG